MSDQDGRVFEEVLLKLGQLQATTEIIKEGMENHAADFRAIHAAQVDHGFKIGGIEVRIAAIENETISRRRRCSEMFKRLGGKMDVVEDTGVHELEKYKAVIEANRVAKKEVFRTAILIFTTIAAITGAVLGMRSCWNGKAASHPIHITRSAIKIVDAGLH